MTQTDHDLRVGLRRVRRRRHQGHPRVYERVFGWQLEDYGPDYTSFLDGRLSGGFTRDAPVRPANPLDRDLRSPPGGGGGEEVRSEGGRISSPRRTEFPGGRRFHFTDPSGNELAVWTEA